ncbi:MAG: hypothetical protein K6G63_10255 [Eubacterium sp.]|nr:hypothetical protein [Eubacterium sp.]
MIKKGIKVLSSSLLAAALTIGSIGVSAGSADAAKIYIPVKTKSTITILQGMKHIIKVKKARKKVKWKISSKKRAKIKVSGKNNSKCTVKIKKKAKTGKFRVIAKMGKSKLTVTYKVKKLPDTRTPLQKNKDAMKAAKTPAAKFNAFKKIVNSSTAVNENGDRIIIIKNTDGSSTYAVYENSTNSLKFAWVNGTATTVAEQKAVEIVVSASNPTVGNITVAEINKLGIGLPSIGACTGKAQTALSGIKPNASYTWTMTSTYEDTSSRKMLNDITSEGYQKIDSLLRAQAGVTLASIGFGK